MSLLITIVPEEPVLSFKAKKKPIHCSLTGPSPTWAKQLHEVAPPVEYPTPHMYLYAFLRNQRSIIIASRICLAG